jgi:predicted restriction endonuclease
VILRRFATLKNMGFPVMIERFLKGFAGLHSNKNRLRWTLATTHRAPHKPLFLLSVIDLISQCRIKTNFIELDSK